MYPQMKSVLALAATSVTAAATATCLIDTMGADFLSLDVYQTTANVVSNKATVAKLQDCDTSNGTFADVSGTVGGTDWTIPNADTSNTYLYKFNVDCRHRKRWLKLSLSPATTQTVTVVGNLARMDRAPVVAADAGANAIIGA